MSTSFSRGRAAGAAVVGRVAQSVAAELLEDRRLFATFTVTNLNADGAGSLWQAVHDANAAAGADVIEFQSGLTGSIVTKGTLRVSESVDVRGPGASKLSVEPANDPEEGRPQGWVIDGPGTNNVYLSGLTLTRGAGDDKNGGAIANSENLILDHVVVTNNGAFGAAGGGIANYGGLTVAYSTISDNSAGGSSDDGGGGIYSEGDLVVRYSTVSGNTSTGGAPYGGGIFVAGGNALIENSTVSGNRAFGYGGGIASRGNLTVRDSTIAFNKAEAGVAPADRTGGGVYVSGGTASLASTIVSDNQTQKSNTDPFVNGDVAVGAGGTLTAVDSLIEVAPTDNAQLSGSTIVGADPKLGALGDNGGPTQTHALLAGSPAIDKGRNASGSFTDQRGPGYARSATNSDIGAFEAGAVRRVTVDESVDAYVQDGDSRNKNFGAGQTLLVKKSSSTGSNRIAYVRFDLSAWDADEPIGYAAIALVGKLTKAQSGGLPMTLLAVSNTTWAENTITYSNRPSTGATLGTFTLNSTETTRFELDVTDYLEAQRAAGKPAVSFAVRGNNNTSALAEFQSDETSGSGFPTLILESGAGANPTPVGATLAASHDTYARNGSYANQTHGGETELLVKSGSSDGAKRETYLKFNIADLEASPSSATLRLFGKVSDGRASSLGVTLYGATNNSWDESTLTYNNKPSAGTSIGTKTITGTTGRWYEWDVAGFVKAAKAAGKSSVTFVIKANASSSPWVAFNSSEAASNGPQLVTT